MKRLAIALLLACVPGTCAGSDLWGTATLRSYHFDRSAGYNEQNFGLGLEYRATDYVRVMGGEYKNSFSDRSWYSGAAGFTQPVRPAGIAVRAGIALGVVTGYDHQHAVRGFSPMVLPMLALEAGGFEAKLGYLPKIDHKTSGVIALQIGVQF